MSVKEQTLAVLEEQKGDYISGAELAEKLSVSRNAVWKAIQVLKEEGYEIASVKNKGYSLSMETDILSEQSIKKYITKYEDVFDLEVRKTLTSTNRIAKEAGASGEKEGKVIIAEEQTEGRGRLGRKFFSPSGSGIYLSLLLRPQMEVSEALLVTTAAAVAVAEAIEFVSGRKAEIKWVNDVYCDNKKVCGVLTEASLGLENGGVEYIVLGIGINVKQPQGGFPDEIKDIATSVYKEADADVRSRLIAEVLERFWAYYQHIHEKTFLQEYKRRSLLIGREIQVLSGVQSEKAVALEINDSCQLKVRMEDGTIRILSSGEVSIKL